MLSGGEKRRYVTGQRVAAWRCNGRLLSQHQHVNHLVNCAFLLTGSPSGFTEPPSILTDLPSVLSEILSHIIVKYFHNILKRIHVTLTFNHEQKSQITNHHVEHFNAII